MDSLWQPQQCTEDAIKRLVASQTSPTRDIEAEQRIADVAHEYLHRADTQDFFIAIELVAGAVFYGRYYPKSTLDLRPDLHPFAIAKCGSLEAAYTLDQWGARTINTYFYDFRLGSDLGYPQELGEKWYVWLGDENGSYYVPVEDVVCVLGTSF